MKTKNQHRILLSVLTVTMVISSVFVTASSINMKTNSKTCGFSDVAELPEWSIGNLWIYDMHFDFTLSGIFSINGMDENEGIKNMRVEVVAINENTGEYTLDISGGYLHVDLEIFGIGFGTYTGDVEGEAHIDISTLAIKDFEFSASGYYKLLIERKTDVTISMTFDPAFDFFDFPIEPAEEPWSADTYASLYGHITVDGLYDDDFSAEGPFENETISFVKQEEITVPGGTFDCFLISGSMGPSHNGWSKLWYSSEVGYLVKVDEKIEDWEGVDAELDLSLQATNCDTSAMLEVTIHRIKMLDPIEILPEWPGADWSYRLSVDNGDNWIDEINDDYSHNEDDHTKDVTHYFNLYTTLPRITIKVWDRDFWSGDDLADVSSQEGGGIDNQIPDWDWTIFKCKYDIVDNILIDNDTVTLEDDFFITSGEYPPDGSTTVDENDAMVWFTITDNYEPPAKPNRPEGPTNGKVGEEYNYTTSTTDPDGEHVKYGWDWNGDKVVDEWTSFYESGETITTSHTWAEKGTYNIRVKAQDKDGLESGWSDPLPVTMPVNYPSSQSQSSSQQSMSPLFFQILERMLGFR